MKSRGLIVLFVAMFALSSFWICEAQSSASGAEEAKDIVDTAVAAGQFKTLAAALKAAGLVETLKGKGPFTVFAPTDEAFAKLPKGTVEGLLKPENKGKLAAILTYHVVPGKVMAKDVVKLSSAKTVQGSEVGIKVSDGKVMVDKATVIAPDIVCGNGVVHVIDAVILPNLFSGTAPVRAEAEPKDIVDTAVSAGNFDTLVAALKAAGLAETLKQPGPFTVFAPTDDAFKQLPPKTLKSLLKPNNKGKLSSVLTYHVVPGRVTAREAFGLENASTVNGQRLDIGRRDGRLVIDGATIIATDINCTNGVIHVIDRVLLPEQERIPALADKTGQFNTLLAAVSAAGLDKVLDGAGPFTVFAPTDDAFKALPKGTVETLLKPENKLQLVDILKYHVVSGRVYSDQAAQAGQAATLLGSVVETSVTADGLRINNALVVKGDLETANGVIHVIDAVLLPQPMSRPQARRTLEDAIRRGVPVFNRGDHRQCAEIYTTACQAIVESASEQVPQSVITALETALDRAKEVDDDRSRAWALRGGMDSALAGLREESPANSSTAEGKERLLFAFDKPEAPAQWRTTNDGVMGGRSDGQFKINEDRNMEFFGTLSLANNGGFASVRSSGSNLGLAKGDSIVARVRGDGREYDLNLYTPTRRIALAYRAKFETRKGQWIEVRIPLDTFVATSFGRVVRNQQLDPSEVNGLGILLGDKKAGPFQLEVEWIKAAKPSE